MEYLGAVKILSFVGHSSQGLGWSLLGVGMVPRAARLARGMDALLILAALLS